MIYPLDQKETGGGSFTRMYFIQFTRGPAQKGKNTTGGKEASGSLDKCSSDSDGRREEYKRQQNADPSSGGTYG